MVRRVATVEVTSPDGTKSLWAVALPHSEAVAAVRIVIPPDHIAELSIRRLLGSQKKPDGLRLGEVRKIEAKTHSKSPSDAKWFAKSIIDSHGPSGRTVNLPGLRR
jgi:hypothetical protein